MAIIVIGIFSQPIEGLDTKPIEGLDTKSTYIYIYMTVDYMEMNKHK